VTRILAAREARKRFRDLDDLIAAIGLQPHEVVRLPNRVTFGAGPAGDEPERRAPGGRVLDI
jgi:hypothetical protein